MFSQWFVSLYPGFIDTKNPNSISNALGRIIGNNNSRNFAIKLLNGCVITRHIHHLVKTGANFYDTRYQTLEIFNLPTADELTLQAKKNGYRWIIQNLHIFLIIGNIHSLYSSLSAQL